MGAVTGCSGGLNWGGSLRALQRKTTRSQMGWEEKKSREGGIWRKGESELCGGISAFLMEG